MGDSIFRRAVTAGRAAYETLNLTFAGLLVVAVAVAVLAATTVVFGGVTEDVTRRNGLSSTDPLHLHWFIEHRTSALISASRVVSEVGSPVVLGLAALVIALWLWMRGLRFGL